MDICELAIENGHIVTPWGIQQADIGIKNGIIAVIGQKIPAQERFDATGLHILPGMIDTQVHFRTPGLTHKEDFAHASRAALLGGITMVFDMPNTTPSTTTLANLEEKVALAEKDMRCHYRFYAGATGENDTELQAMQQHPACIGVKIFMGSSTGNLLIDEEQRLRSALRACLPGKVIAIHAEDNQRLTQRRHFAEKEGHPRAHPLWRDEETALRATKRILKMAREEKRHIHILHISTAQEMELITQHKDIATAEVLVNHLSLHAPDCYEQLGSLAQMNPPVRDMGHQNALWQAVTDGRVDILATDHAPHTLEEKSVPYPQSPSGMPGVQTMLPLMLNQVHQGTLSLPRLVDLCAHGPQRVFGLKRKGRLVVGYDADLTLVDLQKKSVIRNADMASRCGWTPFDGVDVTGCPVAVFLQGQLKMQMGSLVD